MKIGVIGGGASGLVAAGYACGDSNEVYLFEKNEKPGKKIYITGKGRCNVTNIADISVFLENVVSNRKFLYSALNAFDCFDLIKLLEENGVKTKTERGGRVFPVSDKSSDIINALKRFAESRGTKIKLNTTVTDIERVEKGFRLHGCGLENDFFDRVIVATGGLSYKSTGSTGDGYDFARRNGIAVTELSPALCPIVLKDSFISDLEGISLRNVLLKTYIKKKLVFSELGEALFTKDGISGPLALSASSFIRKNTDVRLYLDFKPALSEEQLDARILRDFQNNINKDIVNALNDLTIKKLVPIIIGRAKIPLDKKPNQITVEERRALIRSIKNFELTFSHLADYNMAVITSGGVDCKEINSSTMESKKVPGLYFCGEVLDVDALTGGFNLQIAFSTGFLAGNACI